MTRAILFDLDGTLVDSAPLICAGLRASLAAVGIAAPDDAYLRGGIGLPLPHVWARLGVPADRHAEAVAGYRAGAAAAAPAPAPVFPGIDGMLRNLHAAGHQLVLASAKDTVAARRALGVHGWTDLFAAVSGSEPGDGPDKRGLVGRGLAMLPAGLRRDAVLVGDMPIDGDAATAHGLGFIAVAWGCGERAALLAQAPQALVEDVAGLHRLLA